jgi:hypothetical protein
MNPLQIVLAMFEYGEYLTKESIAERIRQSPYNMRSTDLVAYLGNIFHRNSEYFTCKSGKLRVKLYSRSALGDAELTPSVQDEMITLAVPNGSYVGLRAILSKTRLTRGILRVRLQSLTEAGVLSRRIGVKSEKEAHFTKVEASTRRMSVRNEKESHATKVETSPPRVVIRSEKEVHPTKVAPPKSAVKSRPLQSETKITPPRYPNGLPPTVIRRPKCQTQKSTTFPRS